jgi:hypothetical protein
MDARMLYDASIPPCNRCGSWTWERTHSQTTADLSFVNITELSLLRCGECANEMWHQQVIRERYTTLVGSD